MIKKSKQTTDLQVYKNDSALDIKRAAWSSLSIESQAAYQSDFNLFFNFIKKSPQDVNPNDILAYIQFLENQEMKHSTINRKIASLSKMFRILVLSGEIKINPVQILKELKNISFKISKEIKIALTLDDIKRVTKVRGGSEQDYRVALIIKFLATTGLRISELTGIKNNDILVYNKDHKIIRILGKGKKERKIYISNELFREVKGLYPDNDKTDYLFYSRRYHRHNRKVLWLHIKNAFKKKCDINCHPHMLRHFFITQKISVEKQDIKSVSKYCGHQDISTTLNMYVDISLDVKKAGIKI